MDQVGRTVRTMTYFISSRAMWRQWYRFTGTNIRRNASLTESKLGQHRTIWQEHSAKDFASYESYKRAGILYVFPPFITARMGQKIGRRPQTQLCGDALDEKWIVLSLAVQNK